MFLAQLLPELTSNYNHFPILGYGREVGTVNMGLGLTAVAALAGLDRDDFSGILSVTKFEGDQIAYLGII
jgi:hypothetical protein